MKKPTPAKPFKIEGSTSKAKQSGHQSQVGTAELWALSQKAWAARAAEKAGNKN
jgi:hypothetical protein